MVEDVPKLEFGEKVEEKEEEGRRELGGGAGNKQRTCTMSRGCRSFKEGCMHWRRLNLNELNGELKSLGGFLPVSPFLACWTGRQEIKTQPTTNRPQPTNASNHQIGAR